MHGHRLEYSHKTHFRDQITMGKGTCSYTTKELSLFLCVYERHVIKQNLSYPNIRRLEKKTAC